MRSYGDIPNTLRSVANILEKTSDTPQAVLGGYSMQEINLRREVTSGRVGRQEAGISCWHNIYWA